VSAGRGKPVKGHSGLYRTERGRVAAVYRGGDGRERHKTFDTVLEAERFRRDQLGRRDRREWAPPEAGRVPFADVAAATLSAGVNRRPDTVARDESLMRVHVVPFFDSATGRFTPSDCRAFVAELVEDEYAPATVAKCAQLARAVFDHAVLDRVIPSSPWVGVKLPRIERHVAMFLRSTRLSTWPT
jgi:hypothetical protein